MTLTFMSVVLGSVMQTLCMASCILTTTKSTVIPTNSMHVWGLGLFLNLINRDTDKHNLFWKSYPRKLWYNLRVITLKRVKRRVYYSSESYYSGLPKSKKVLHFPFMIIWCMVFKFLVSNIYGVWCSRLYLNEAWYLYQSMASGSVV